MIFAAFGDIEGDLAALDAAIRSAEEAGLLTLVCTGNSVVGGPQGEAVLQQLWQREIRFVAGRLDRAAAHFQKKKNTLARKLSEEDFARVRAAHEALPSDALERLAGVPHETRLTLEGVEVILCYGALGSKRDIITAESPTQNLERQREIAPVELIITGGAPAPFHRLLGDTHFVCPGPLRADTSHIRYALINTEERPFTVTFPEVPLPG